MPYDTEKWMAAFESSLEGGVKFGSLTKVGQAMIVLAIELRRVSERLDGLQARLAPLPETATETLARDLATRPLTVDDDADGHPTRREMAHVLGTISIAITRLGDGLAQHEGVIREILALFDNISTAMASEEETEGEQGQD
jgi:hypothetical protein